MQQIGYSLVDAKGNELQAFGDIAGQFPSPPDVIRLSNGDFVHCATLGEVFSDGSKLVLRQLVDSKPAPWFASTSATINFDGAQVVKTIIYSTTPDYTAVASTIGVECKRRIYEIASDTAQTNLIGNAIAGTLSDADMTTYKDAVAWIAAMIAVCRSLISTADATFADDAHWPTPSDAVVTLASKF